MKTLFVLVTFLMVLSLLMAACGQATTTPAPPSAPVTPASPAPSAIDAAKLFATNCVVCHGPNRQGIAGLGLPLTPAALAAKSNDELNNTVTNGKPNTATVGFQGRLSAAEIDALVKFIKNTPP